MLGRHYIKGRGRLNGYFHCQGDVVVFVTSTHSPWRWPLWKEARVVDFLPGSKVMFDFVMSGEDGARILIVKCYFGISSFLSLQATDNPNFLESEQWTVPISSNFRGSTELVA
ncbi:hypothetical protein AVEN_110510-1 [Araneus ventricosus]|uniref:Uncharacterized protein n=1 Tax=Araneus ventricosus TaxID=182803 RepID=A0A4Y2GUA2_ARAVE|nr:hypothetical protein AVEN_110510-1 [Araneus ventricosus]